MPIQMSSCKILDEVGRDQYNKIQRYKGLGDGCGAAMGDDDGSGEADTEARYDG